MGSIAQSIFPDNWAIKREDPTDQSFYKVEDPAFGLLTQGAISFDLTPLVFNQTQYFFSMSSRHTSGANSYLFCTIQNTGTGRIRISRRNLLSGASENIYSVPYSLAIGVKARVLITSEVKMYVDGVLQATAGGATISPGWFGGLTPNPVGVGKIFTLFGIINTSVPTGGSGSNAIINGVRLWNRVPTSGEIALDVTTRDWTQEPFADAIVTAYEFEQDLLDTVGTDHLTPTLTPSYVAS